MDNVFEILIYAIIIISFLSSIFKKRGKLKQPPAQEPLPEDYSQHEVSIPQTQQKEEYDILREVEDFFKVESELPRQEKRTVTQREEPKRMTQIEEHTQDESWHTPTASEHFADDWEHKKTEVKKKVARVDTGIEKQAAKFEESLVKKKPATSEITSLIKARIKNPSTLKEYVIFSEIIGKPKALKR
jgi:hypothetical protein